MKMPDSTSGLLPFSKTPSNNFFFHIQLSEALPYITSLLQEVAHAFSFFFFPQGTLAFLNFLTQTFQLKLP